MPYVAMICTKCGRQTSRHHNARKCYDCNATTLRPVREAAKAAATTRRIRDLESGLRAVAANPDCYGRQAAELAAKTLAGGFPGDDNLPKSPPPRP